MTTKGGLKRPIRQLAVREKIDAIDRVHTGESKASVARDIGVPESTLRGWCKSEEKLRTVARTCGTPDSEHSEPERKRARSEEHGGAVVSKQPAPETPLNMTKSQLNQPPQRKPQPPQATPAKTQEVDETLWYWLKQQQQQATLNSSLLDPKLSGLDKEGSGWFWRWYKNYGYSEVATPPTANNNNHNHRRSALESALESRESDEEDLDEDEPPATAAEAVAHGEKFLRWLECCSDPSVTAMQILQFRYLLNNVRACADRRARGSTRSRRK